MASVEKIKELRDRTHVSVTTCKQALDLAGDDVEKAIQHLRLAGEIKAQDVAARTTSQGRVEGYIHPGNQIGVIVRVACESDFVAKGEHFIQFCKDVAMHIAAANPLFITSDDASFEWRQEHHDFFGAQIAADPKLANKPPQMIDKIRCGKVDKLLKELCLLDQPFVKDPTKTVGNLLSDLILATGENVRVLGFKRLSVKDAE